MAMSPRADGSPIFLFDFDGVIGDSFDAFFGAYTDVCTEMGFDRINSKAAFLGFFEGNPIRQLLWAGFPLFRLKRVAMRYRPRLEAANASVRPFSGMPELLNEVAQDHPVYIVTSNASPVIAEFCGRFGIAGLHGIVGVDHAVSKVRKIRQVRRRHPGALAYYIGDTKGDMIEARRAGAVSIAAAWGWHPRATLEQAEPDYVADSPEALRGLIERLAPDHPEHTPPPSPSPDANDAQCSPARE